MGTFTFQGYASSAQGTAVSVYASQDGASSGANIPGRFDIFTFDGTGGGASRLAVRAAGYIEATAALAASSKTTGTLRVTGGVGISGATFTDTLHVITMANTTQSNSVCYNTGSGLLTYVVGDACTTSSARYKKDIYEISPANSLALASQMVPVAFRYRPETGLGDEMFVGLLAEQVASVDPRLVVFDAQGRPDNVRYGNAVALAFGAIQQLRADNDNLKLEIENLKRAIR